jgi:Cu(I)/Ag(I) efflux system membrane protein CusA/SilA
VQLPRAYAVEWSGQFEYLARATAKADAWIVPVVLAIIYLLI